MQPQLLILTLLLKFTTSNWCDEMSNGCSLVPDYNFKWCCNNHDICYACGACPSFNHDRSSCDSMFYHQMIDECDTLAWYAIPGCYEIASTYYLGVRAGGWGFYLGCDKGCASETCDNEIINGLPWGDLSRRRSLTQSPSQSCTDALTVLIGVVNNYNNASDNITKAAATDRFFSDYSRVVHYCSTNTFIASGMLPLATIPRLMLNGTATDQACLDSLMQDVYTLLSDPIKMYYADLGFICRPCLARFLRALNIWNYYLMTCSAPERAVGPGTCHNIIAAMDLPDLPSGVVCNNQSLIESDSRIKYECLKRMVHVRKAIGSCCFGAIYSGLVRQLPGMLFEGLSVHDCSDKVVEVTLKVTNVNVTAVAKDVSTFDRVIRGELTKLFPSCLSIYNVSIGEVLRFYCLPVSSDEVGNVNRSIVEGGMDGGGMDVPSGFKVEVDKGVGVEWKGSWVVVFNNSNSSMYYEDEPVEPVKENVGLRLVGVGVVMKVGLVVVFLLGEMRIL